LPREHYLNASYGLKSWLLTTDHKRIALLFLASITAFFFPGRNLCRADPDRIADTNRALRDGRDVQQLFTMHGLIMVFFFLIPSIRPYWAIFCCR